MNLPISTSSSAGLIVAAILGTLFGVLLHKGKVADYNVIVNFFRLKDLTVLKVMLTAVAVGGIGAFVLIKGGAGPSWHIKPTYLFGVSLGAAIFGVGMVLYGYCPGTGVAAIATGSVHAIVGFGGMLVGGVVYALSYPWISENVLSVGSYGKIRLSDIVPLSDGAIYALLGVITYTLFKFLERNTPKAKKKAEPKSSSSSRCCGSNGG